MPARLPSKGFARGAVEGEIVAPPWWLRGRADGQTADPAGPCRQPAGMAECRPGKNIPCVGEISWHAVARHGAAGWSSPVARQAHNLKVAGSNPAPATNLRPWNASFRAVFVGFLALQPFSPRFLRHPATSCKTANKNQRRDQRKANGANGPRQTRSPGKSPWRAIAKSPFPTRLPLPVRVSPECALPPSEHTCALGESRSIACVAARVRTTAHTGRPVPGRAGASSPPGAPADRARRPGPVMPSSWPCGTPRNGASGGGYWKGHLRNY